jgi:hypothetical protein
MQGTLLSRAHWLRPTLLLAQSFAQPRRAWISTLVPERLLPTDLLDLSGLKGAPCRIDGPEITSSILVYTSPYDAQKGSRRVPFPPDTRGILYCHVPDPTHPVATEVRFRLAQGGVDDPQAASMLRRDLLLAPETPWRIHATNIARS